MFSRQRAPLRRLGWSWLSVCLFLAVVAVPLVYGDGPWGRDEDPMRAAWLTTDFQAINLAPDDQPIVAHFFAPGGEQVYTFSDTLPAGASRYYDPADFLPAGFTGTVVLETPVLAAMGVIHLDELLQQDGNTVFTGVYDERLGEQAFFSIDRCIYIYIHSMHPSSGITVTLNAYALGGSPVGSRSWTIPPHGVARSYPRLSLGLPGDFVGLGVVSAGWPLEVTVCNVCGGAAAYVAPRAGSPQLLIPRLPPEALLVTTTMFVHNTAPTATLGEIRYSSGLTESFGLPGFGGLVRSSPFTDVIGGAGIVAGQPLAAVVRTVDRRPGSEGTSMYAALDPNEATPAVALPVLFAGYEGWETGDNIWVRNVAPVSTTVRIRYVTAPTGTVFWDRLEVGPASVGQFALPELPAQRAAAILLADQPILVVAGADNLILPRQVRDRQIRYQGTNFSNYALVSGVDFSWVPAAPLALQPLVFSATVWADGGLSPTRPLSFTWDLGDGTTSRGDRVSHRYQVPGAYTVTLTATNYLGFGVVSTRQPLNVAQSPWTIYLPVVLK